MFFRRDIDDALYREYREVVSSERMIDAMRSGIVVVVCLNLLFVTLDLWVFPERFYELLAVRIAWTAVMAGMYFSRWPADGASRAITACHCTGLGLVVVISAAGGLPSGYAPGLMLLFLGLPVLIPMSAGQAAQVVSVSLGALAIEPFVMGADLTFRAYAMNIFFPAAAAIECVASCAVLEGMRIADFMQRREIQTARDELAELDQAKSRFSANVHHELRTPLTLILAPLDAIRSGDFGEISPMLRDTVETMHANGRRLFKLISNLLDLSKLESKLFEIHRAPVDLEELATDLVTAARGMAERKEIRLEMSGFDGLPGINADATAVEKILMNLVGNALKFTPAGGTIELIGEAVDGGVRMHVKDSGVGIPPDKLDAVFDRFAQVDGSATRSHEGTGIGLSLAFELAQLHGGDVRAHSDGRGHGTTMTVFLPIGEADAGDVEDVLRTDAQQALGLGHSIEAVEAELNIERDSDVPEGASVAAQAAGDLVEIESLVERWEDREAANETVAVAGAPDGALSGEVLIAEDNPDMRRLLATLLGREFRVRTTRNGLEALEQVRLKAPDLVLSDVMMPEMSGIELCREIKTCEETNAIPVVLVTSKAEHEMQVEGLELGADDYITKPFHPRELMARVRTLVRVRGLQRELAQKNERLQATLDDLKQAEVQIIHNERLAAVGELAAGIAHEVNNPVNFALNASRALDAEFEGIREDVMDAARRDAPFPLADPENLATLAQTIRELSDIIRSGLERTKTLVADLRDFAAPGRKSNHAPNISVETGIRSTLQLLRPGLSEANAEVQLDVLPGLPLIKGDPGALNQVFLNLIKNAADAFEGQGGHIDIRVLHDASSIRVEVQDDGPGIPHDVRRQIFDPFFTTKSAGQGTGLGLSISRKIIENHAGALEVDCPENGGTIFRVTLPRVDD